MAPNDPSVWLRARELIKKELNNDQAFNIWFGPVNFHSMSEDILTLEIPNKLFQDILLDRYTAVLNSNIAKSCGKEMKVEFSMQESSDGTSPKQPLDATTKEKAQGKTFWPFGRDKQDAGKETGLNSRYTFDSFVIGPSNRFAHAAASAICDWPSWELSFWVSFPFSCSKL